MLEREYYTITSEARERFYKLPKIFFTNPIYKKISNDAKIAYAILLDRLELSIKNNWFDDKGRIFFIYTIKELETILNCGNKKVIKIKKELTDVGLLDQKRQGLNKPNLMYLIKPIVTINDIYGNKKTTSKSSESMYDKEMSKRHIQKCRNDTSKNVKKTHQKMSKQHINDTELNNTDFNKTKNKLNNHNTYEENSDENKKILLYIGRELNIKMTKAYQNKLLKLVNYFDFETLEYAIYYVSMKANNPKQYLLKILEIWIYNNIDTLEKAKEFKYNYKNKVNEKEITPEWLIKGTHKNRKGSKEKRGTNSNDIKLKKDSEKFLKKLKEEWDEM